MRLALVDGFLKRYLRGYVAAAVLIMAFDRTLDQQVFKFDTSQARAKYDLTHLSMIHDSLAKVLVNFYGHHKYVFQQTLANVLRRRFSILFF